MRRYRRSPVSLLIALFVLGQLAGPALAQPAPPSPAAPEATSALSTGQVRITEVAGGLSSPVGVVNAGDGTNRLFIVEQRGTVRVVPEQRAAVRVLPRHSRHRRRIHQRGRARAARASPSTRTSSRTASCSRTTPNGGGDLVIAELTANAASTSVSASTADPLMHDRAQLACEPQRRAAAVRARRLPVHLHRRRRRRRRPGRERPGHERALGKVLRIAPNLNGGYTTPVRQPVRRIDAGRRCDLGLSACATRGAPASTARTARSGSPTSARDTYEEINREPARAAGGRNYGWDCREGAHPFDDPTPGSPARAWLHRSPIAEYTHAGGNCSVTGGFVYRGGVFPDLVGQYVLGDYCSGRMWTLQSGAGSPSLVFHRDTSALITLVRRDRERRAVHDRPRAAGCTAWSPRRSPTSPNSQPHRPHHVAHLRGHQHRLRRRQVLPERLGHARADGGFLVRALDLPATGEDFFTDDNRPPTRSTSTASPRPASRPAAPRTATARTAAVTRGQMASFLVRAFDLPATGNDYFTDDEGSIHEDEINRLRARRTSPAAARDRFCPTASTTRARDGGLPAPGHRDSMRLGGPSGRRGARSSRRSRRRPRRADRVAPPAEPARAGGRGTAGPGHGPARRTSRSSGSTGGGCCASRR